MQILALAVSIGRPNPAKLLEALAGLIHSVICDLLVLNIVRYAHAFQVSYTAFC